MSGYDTGLGEGREEDRPEPFQCQWNEVGGGNRVTASVTGYGGLDLRILPMGPGQHAQRVAIPRHAMADFVAWVRAAFPAASEPAALAQEGQPGGGLAGGQRERLLGAARRGNEARRLRELLDEADARVAAGEWPEFALFRVGDGWHCELEGGGHLPQAVVEGPHATYVSALEAVSARAAALSPATRTQGVEGG